MQRYWKGKTKAILYCAIVICSTIAVTNYIVDPFWCFQHNVQIGKYQFGFDERQQKTNHLAFSTKEIDTVILGNSRVTYMDTHTVPGKAFNFAVSSMQPHEFLPYIEFIANNSTLPLKTVILGLSFRDIDSVTHPREHIEKTLSWGFRLISLVNLDLFIHSLKAMRMDFLKNTHDLYIRNGLEISAKQMKSPFPTALLQKAISADISIYRTKYFAKNSCSIDDKHIFLDLKNTFPSINFRVFTTPVSAHLLHILLEQDLFDEYIRWLSGIVDAFGELWNFMYFNEVTNNDKFYKDAHHYSPYICDLITKKLYEMPNESGYSNFGEKVTSENLKKHIDFLKDNMLQTAPKH